MESRSAPFFIRLLGPVQVEQGGEPVKGFESHKALALLGYLTVQQQAVAREKLVGLLWGGQNEKRARANFRRALHNLNMLLPGCLQADRYTVRLVLSPRCQSDIERFSRLTAEQTDIAALSQAVALYRGDFMEGLTLEDCPEFETWLTVEQERWRQRAVRAFDALARAYMRAEEYTCALDVAQRLLSLTPWRESAHYLVMDLLARTGQRGEALRQYQRCRRMLAEEFGVEPAAETRALYRRIRAADARPPMTLPAPLTSFVGRQRELAEMHRLLTSPDCRLLTLLGLGGVGKTRLALRYAEVHAGAFLDGVVFVPLDSIADADHLLLALAQALDVSLPAAAEGRCSLCDYLTGKEMLLILDNVEPPIAGGSALLTDLLQAARGVKMLLTSRQRLNLPGEWVFPLEGLALSSTEGLALSDTEGLALSDTEGLALSSTEGLALSSTEGPALSHAEGPALSHAEGPTAPKSEAVLLFEQRALQANPAFESNPYVPRICAALGGHPLAIELAAALTAYFPCEEIFARLQDGLGEALSPVDRQYSLHTMLESALAVLDEEERAAFRNLTIFRGGFSLEAARHVVGLAPRVIASLTGKSLLRRVAGGRYQMHPLLRRYGEQLRRRDPQADRTLQRAHSRYFADFLFRRREVFRGDPELLYEIESEFGNIHQAWRWALEQVDAALIDRSADTLGMVYCLRGRYQLGEEEYSRAAAGLRRRLSEAGSAEAGQIRLALARVLGWQGEFRLDRGEYAAAQGFLEESVALFRDLERTLDAAWRLHDLGTSQMQQGALLDAARCFEESLSIFQSADEENGAALCLQSLGTLAALRGQYAQAQERYVESLRRYRRVGDAYGVAEALYSLGEMARLRGDYAAARGYFSESLQGYAEISSQHGVARCYEQLGHLARLQGEYRQARDDHQRSLSLYEEMGERDGMASALVALGMDAFHRGEHARAMAYCKEGLRLFQEIGHRRGVVSALTCLGRIQTAMGEDARAGKLLRQALQIAREIETTPQLMEALLAIAHWLVARQHFGRAAEVIALLLHEKGVPREVQQEAQSLSHRLAEELSPPRFGDRVEDEMHCDPRALLARIETAFLLDE